MKEDEVSLHSSRAKSLKVNNKSIRNIPQTNINDNLEIKKDNDIINEKKFR
jgi:hypothetical protein